MKYKNHGEWEQYTPEEKPFPSNTLFARRKSDGMDWYKYVHGKNGLNKDTVKLTISIDGYSKKPVVAAVSRDPERMFPPGCTVIELESSDSKDLQKDFGRKSFNFETGEFGEREYPSTEDPMDKIAKVLGDIGARLVELEKKIK